MALKEMFSGLVNSPETTITSIAGVSDTTIYVLDPTRVPATLPNLMVLGTGTNAETVKVTAINNSALTVVRGFQGVAKEWPVGTTIARNFTEYDYGALVDNILDLAGVGRTTETVKAISDAIANLAGTGRTTQTVKANADAIANLAGTGRTTQTVKGNADNLTSHIADATKHVVKDGTLQTNLNADKLDGNDATAFATAAHNHTGTYSPVGHDHAGTYEPADADIMRKDVAQTMAAQLTAQNNTNYATAQARNIILSTADPSGGGNGDVWIKYTA